MDNHQLVPKNSELIMYQTEDGKTKIDVRLENETVWLSQAQIAELFQRDRSVISKHIKNVFSEGEMDEKSNVQNLHITFSGKFTFFKYIFNLFQLSRFNNGRIAYSFVIMVTIQPWVISNLFNLE